MNLARPRNRKELNHLPEFKRIRKEVFDYLLGPGRRAESGMEAQNQERAVPQLTPRDLAGGGSRRRAAFRQTSLMEAAT